MKRILYQLTVVLTILIIILSGCKSEQSHGLKFDDESGYVDFKTSPKFDANDSFTFELWVKLLEDIDKSAVLFGPAANNDGAYGIHAYYLGRLAFGVRTKDNLAWVFISNYQIHEWMHIAGVYDGSSKKVQLYINGVFVQSSTLKSDAVELSNNNFVLNHSSVIGGPGSKRGRLKCVINDARLWGVARTELQIKENMNKRLKGNEKGLIGYWPLNETRENIAHDHSKNLIHGEVIGATWYFEE